MNYKHVYDQLIEKRRKSVLRKSETYCEVHHIVPKSLGGKNNAKNLICLLAKEHLLAHKLLVKITAQQYGAESQQYRSMIQALWFMQTGAKQNANRKLITGKSYEKLRLAYRKSISGKNARQFGKTGKLSPTYGMVHTAKAKEANRIKHLGRKTMHHPKTDLEVHALPQDVQSYLRLGYVFGASKHSKENFSRQQQGKIWIVNKVTQKQKFIAKDKLAEFQQLGFEVGLSESNKLKRAVSIGRIWMSKDGKQKLVKKEFVESMIAAGYSIGRHK